MSQIIIIVAVAKNRVIGKRGKIPWYIKEDFQHFKQLTLGHPVIRCILTQGPSQVHRQSDWLGDPVLNPLQSSVPHQSNSQSQSASLHEYPEASS